MTATAVDVDELKPLFDWRSKICDSDLAPTTRHVALTLALYMNARGGSAHPGPSRLAHDTGLSLRAVKTHLKALVDDGWIVVTVHGGADKGGNRIANVYEARVPTRVSDDTNTDPTTRAADTPVHDMHPCSTFTGAADDNDPCISRQRPVHQVHPISSKSSSRTHQRARDPIPATTVTAALEHAFGRAAATTSERKLWRTASREIAEALTTADTGPEPIDIDDEIARRSREWAARGYTAPITPTSLAKHWGNLGQPATTAPPPTPSSTPPTPSHPADRSRRASCPLDRCDGSGLILPDDGDEVIPCACKDTAA